MGKYNRFTNLLLFYLHIIKQTSNDEGSLSATDQGAFALPYILGERLQIEIVKGETLWECNTNQVFVKGAMTSEKLKDRVAITFCTYYCQSLHAEFGLSFGLERLYVLVGGVAAHAAVKRCLRLNSSAYCSLNFFK